MFGSGVKLRLPHFVRLASACERLAAGCPLHALPLRCSELLHFTGSIPFSVEKLIRRMVSRNSTIYTAEAFSAVVAA